MKLSDLARNGLADALRYRFLAAGFEGRDVMITRKVCQNTNLSSGTGFQDLWGGGGVYTGFPDASVTPEQFGIASDSALDTANGTGARSVLVVGLDANWNEISEVVVLAGTTEVFTTNTYRRFIRMQVATSGSSVVNGVPVANLNQGTITTRYRTTTAYVFSRMPPLFGQSRCGAYTVPAGYEALFLAAHFDMNRTTAGTVLGDFWYQPFGAAPRMMRPWVVSNAHAYEDTLVGGVLLSEKSDMIPRARDVSNNSMNVFCIYELLVFKM